MANKKNSKSSSKKKNTQAVDGNPGLLFIVLLICVAILLFIVYMTRNEDNDLPNETETPKTVITDGTVTDTPSENENTAVNGSETVSDVSETAADTEDTAVESDNTIETEDIGYTVETDAETKKTENGDAIMEYPTIDSPEESDVDAEFINALIRDYMNDKLREEQLEQSITDPDVTYRYEIKSTETKLATKDFISLLIIGEYYIVDSPHPTIFAYTINCDLKTGKIIPSGDFITDFSVIKNEFTSGGFSLVYGVDGLLEETNYNDMIMEYRTEYGIYPEIYFTEDSFGMVVDLVYALGGYAVFEIPYGEIQGAVKAPV